MRGQAKAMGIRGACSPVEIALEAGLALRSRTNIAQLSLAPMPSFMDVFVCTSRGWSSTAAGRRTRRRRRRHAQLHKRIRLAPGEVRAALPLADELAAIGRHVQLHELVRLHHARLELHALLLAATLAAVAGMPSFKERVRLQHAAAVPGALSSPVCPAPRTWLAARLQHAVEV